MKKIAFVFLLMLALPVMAIAQYTGGSGSGDASLTYSSALGINDFQDQRLSVNVFPNPTTGSIKLSIEYNPIESLKYQLYDFNGRLLNQQKIGSRQTYIQMENLPSASYFLKVTDHNKTLKTFRIIKN